MLINRSFVILALFTAGLSPVRAGGPTVFPSGWELQELRGAELPDLSLAEPSDTTADPFSTIAFDVMRRLWNMNAVRIPTSSRAWEQDAESYLDRLQRVVERANRSQLVVIIALKEDPPSGWNLKMPTSLSVAYWKAVAERFRNVPYVVFDLYDAPEIQPEASPSEVPPEPDTRDWEYWREGGVRNGERHVGMISLAQVVNNIEPRRYVILQGLYGGRTLVQLFKFPPFSSLPTANPPVSGLGLNIILAIRQDLGMVASLQDFNWHYSSFNWGLQLGDAPRAHTIMFLDSGAKRETLNALACSGISNDETAASGSDLLFFLDQRHYHWMIASFQNGGLIRDPVSFKPTTMTGTWNCNDIPPGIGMGQLTRGRLTETFLEAWRDDPFVTVSAATGNTHLASGALASAYGPALTLSDSVVVTVADSSGASRAASVIAASPSRIDYQVPAATVPGPVTVTIARNDGATLRAASTVAAVMPELFAADSSGRGAAAGLVWYVGNDGDAAEPELLATCGGIRYCTANPVNPPIGTGRVILSLFGTGFRNATTVSCELIGSSGGILYSGDPLYSGAAPQSLGIDQLNVEVPLEFLESHGQLYNVRLRADNILSNTIQIEIR